MSDDTKQFEALALHLVEPLVTRPEALRAEVRADASGVLTVYVSVDPDDVGRVIGRQGKMIRSLRSVMTLTGRTLGRSASLEVLG